MIPSHPSERLPELMAAYAAAEYLVPSLRCTIRVDELCPEADAWLEEAGLDTWVFITAWNPWSVVLPQEENAARHHKLLALVGHLPHLHGIGRDLSGAAPDEEGLLVGGLSLEEGVHLAQELDQAAILFARYREPVQLVAGATPPILTDYSG
jgi:hypothetical protein